MSIHPFGENDPVQQREQSIRKLQAIGQREWAKMTREQLESHRNEALNAQGISAMPEARVSHIITQIDQEVERREAKERQEAQEKAAQERHEAAEKAAQMRHEASEKEAAGRHLETKVDNKKVIRLTAWILAFTILSVLLSVIVIIIELVGH
jgi:hypothetical protein